MRKILFLSAFMAFFSLAHTDSYAQKADDIIGLWRPSEGTSYIQIYKDSNSSKYYGKIVWLKEPNNEKGQPKRDPKGDLILKMVNLKDFIFEDDEWTDGTIYDPKSGNLYYCSIEMPSEDRLEVRGSVDPFGLVGRTDVWVRMKRK